MRFHLCRRMRTTILLIVTVTCLLNILSRMKIITRRSQRSVLRENGNSVVSDDGGGFDPNLAEIDRVPQPGINEEIVVDFQKQPRPTPATDPKTNSKTETTLLSEILKVHAWDVPDVFRCAYERYKGSRHHSETCGKLKVNGNTSRPFNLTIWTQDYDLATIQDLRFLLEPFGVTLIEKSLSPYCAMFGVCGNDLRAVNMHNGIELHHDVVSQFHAEYLQDSQFQSADAFLCVHPAAMCELFMPFGKSLIVYVGSRFELGRWTSERYRSWNVNLRAIGKDDSNMLLASNHYDVEYIRFYTKLEPTVLPHYCGYIAQSYLPTESTFLMTHVKAPGFEEYFGTELDQWKRNDNISISVIIMDGKRVDQSQTNLVKHSGIIYIPDQVSSLRLTEFYRLNIPLFVPSYELLTKWHMRYQIVRGRTWQHVRSHIRDGIDMRKEGLLSLPNPNDERQVGSVGFWLQFADIYTWPHMIYFNSIRELLAMMKSYRDSGKLRKISKKMQVHNEATKRNVKGTWLSILKRIQERKNNMQLRK